jgi:cytidylate kinase
VFRHHPNHINVLIQAPMEKRIQRLMKKQNMSAEEAEKTIRRIDKMRDNYVTKYTGESRYDTRNYDLVINMDSINEDDAAALIMQYIEDSQKQ